MFNIDCLKPTPPPSARTGATDLSNSLAIDDYLRSVIPSQFPQGCVANVIGTVQNLDGSLNTALLSPDRLHPLDTGYQQIANAFFVPIVSSVMSTRHDTVMQMPTLTMSGTTDQWVAQIDLGEIDLVISNSDLANLTDQKVRPCHGQQGRMARQSNHLVGRHQ